MPYESCCPNVRHPRLIAQVPFVDGTLRDVYEDANREEEPKQFVLGNELERVYGTWVHGGQGSLPLKTRSFLDFCVPRLRAALADLLPASAALPVPGLSSS
jgi:hypothetical protein